MRSSRSLLVCGIAALFAGTLFAAPSVYAQGNRFALGGGATFPTGKYSELAQVGWHATGSLNFGRHDSRLGLLIDGTYGELGFDVEGFDVKQRWIYGTANLVYRFKRAGSESSHADPYVIGGGGVYSSKGIGDDADLFGDDSSTDFGLDAGLGLNYTVSRIVLYLEARYHTVFTDADDSHFIPLTLGIRFGR
jgi:Outer membrane protein beta-barrel domain